MTFSTQYHRITIADFRPCLICQSHNQASNILLCSTNKKFYFELTLARLRYHLGGDRPSQTTSYAMSYISNKKFSEAVFHTLFN